MNTRISKLTLICDPGTSLSKVLYRVGRKGQLKHLTMSSEILKLDGNLVTNFKKSSEFGKPEDNAWLQTDERPRVGERRKGTREENDYSCYLVGRLAREYRASTSIRSLKYESIVPKIIAIVGAIA
ncbi:hypothetical protein IQ255_30185, partial [Pleurocapsales cyanobacterium LEGE 10410]|nr:hypothetical protein [Pleurocapsales cyanobacterium LEGE 10410]